MVLFAKVAQSTLTLLHFFAISGKRLGQYRLFNYKSQLNEGLENLSGYQ